MIEQLDLEAIKERADAATAGPWEIGPAGFDRRREMIGAPDTRGNMVGFVETRHFRKPDDAEFIAHARTDIPALVAEVERLRAVAHSTAGDYSGQDVSDLTAMTAVARWSDDKVVRKSSVLEPGGDQ